MSSKLALYWLVREIGWRSGIEKMSIYEPNFGYDAINRKTNAMNKANKTIFLEGSCQRERKRIIVVKRRIKLAVFSVFIMIRDIAAPNVILCHYLRLSAHIV